MSKKSNVNPDHYKTAGRHPQGQDVIQEVERQKFREQEAFLEKQADRRNPVSAANRVRIPSQNRSLDTASEQETIGEREHVNDQPLKAPAKKKPTRRVAGKPKATAEKKPTRRVAGKRKATAEKKPRRRVAGKRKATAKKKATRRVAGKPKAAAKKKATRRVAGKRKATAKKKATRRVAGKAKERAPAPRGTRPKSKSQKKVSKRGVEKRLRPPARSRRKRASD